VTNKLAVSAVLSVAVCSAALADTKSERSPFANAEETPTAVVKAGACEVRCVDPHACGQEDERVIGILHKLVAAYSQGDIKTYEKYLDDNCSMFEEGTKKLLSGKAQVLEHLKQSFVEHAPGGAKPLVSFTIDQPFAKVNHDTCVVTFVATKEIGGAHPYKERAHITDVFVKRNGDWKKLHWSGKWERLTDS
jgi:hypothetical protein